MTGVSLEQRKVAGVVLNDVAVLPGRGDRYYFVQICVSFCKKYEKPIGDFTRAYSRRINIQHCLVYQIYDEEKVAKIIRMWTHYE